MDDEKIFSLIDQKLNNDLCIFDGSIPISAFVLEYLQKYKESDVSKLFKVRKKNSNECILHDVEFTCLNCGSYYYLNASKSTILNTIYRFKMDSAPDKHNHCPNCLIEVKELQQKKNNEIAENNKINRQIETENFINSYLNPLKKFDSNSVPSKFWFDYVKGSFNFTEKHLVLDYASKMPYKDFLKTPYWQGIRQKVLYKFGYKCALCSSKENLNIHHRSYENRGKEIENQSDLICLCYDCHSTFHENEKI